MVKARKFERATKTPLNEPSFRSDLSTDSLGGGQLKHNLTSQRSSEALLPRNSRNSNPNHLNPSKSHLRLSSYSSNSFSQRHLHVRSKDPAAGMLKSLYSRFSSTKHLLTP